MRATMKSTLAIAGVAGALIVGTLASADAQTWRRNDPYYGPHGGYYRHGGLMSAPVAGRFGPGYIEQGGFAWLGRSCVTDEGYGRFLPCDIGGAQ